MKEFGEKVKDVEYLRRPGSYAVMIKDGQIGVLKASGYDTYFLVGGGIDAGESETEALRREAAEEIGFRIEVGEKIGEAVEYSYSAREKQYIAKECHFYRVVLKGKANEKGKHELVWITRNQLDRLHHQSYQWIVEEESDESQNSR